MASPRWQSCPVSRIGGFRPVVLEHGVVVLQEQFRVFIPCALGSRKPFRIGVLHCASLPTQLGWKAWRIETQPGCYGKFLHFSLDRCFIARSRGLLNRSLLRLLSFLRGQRLPPLLGNRSSGMAVKVSASSDTSRDGGPSASEIRLPPHRACRPSPIVPQCPK